MRPLLLVFIAALLVPLGSASAQGALNAPACPILAQSLSLGARDSTTNPRGQVSALQRFLAGHYGLPTGDYVTGYFGRLTRDNVRRFQCEFLKVCSGSETATGYGSVGPKTRAAIAARCNAAGGAAAITVPAPEQCISPPRPSLSCDGAWQKFYNAKNCHVGWTCVVAEAAATAGAATAAQSNKAPLVSAITGPTSVLLGSSGAWNVTASDPEGDALVYSVVWGDEGPSVATLLNIAQQGTPYVSAASFTHTYGQTGSYALVVFAKDSSGNIVKATLSIVIYEPPPPPPPIANTSQTPQEQGGGASGGGGGGVGASGGNGACSYKGQSYAEGQSVTVPNPGAPGTYTFTCDNATWLWINVNPNTPSYALYNGSGLCLVAGALLLPQEISDFGCTVSTNTSVFAMIPRHGKAPFATSITVAASEIGSQLLGAITINWGDGSTGGIGAHSPVGPNHIENYSHTYTSPGSYAITVQWQNLSGDKSASGTVRVDP